MTTSVAVFPPGFRVTDANDLPVSGAVIEFYAAGTTTPKTVYSDADLSVAIGTSVTCDSGGYPSSGGNRVLVYVNENAYKIIGKDSSGNTLWEHDDVLGAIVPGSGSGSGGSSDAFGFKVGMVALTLTSSPEAGWIRLTDSTQSLVKADYPDLNAWASAQGYPWGSSSTTFNIPPAGGYFLRFGSSGSSIDPSGPRSPGSTQTDAFQGHKFNITNTSSPFGTVNGGSPGVGTSGTLGNSGSATPAIGSVITDGTNGTPRTATETRAINVAMYADMLAVPALVASSLVGAVGPAYKWNSSTSAADVSSGRLALNNATIDSATTFYCSETSDNGSALSSFLQAIPSGSKVFITKVGTPATFITFTLSSTATDAGSYDSFTITSVSHGGTLSNGDTVSVVFMPAGTSGSNGTPGSNGTDPGIRWLFASSTTMADPSSGNIRFNNATLASVTAISVHYSSGETGNPSVENWVKGWDDATTTTVLGTLVIKKASAPQNFVILHVNAALTDNTTWAQIPVTYVDSSGSFSASDVLSVQFDRAGNKGADGAGTGDVTGPASSVDSEIALFSSTTGKVIKRASTTGVLKAASGVLSAAAATDLGAGLHVIYVPATAMVSRTTNGAAAGTVETTTNKIMLKTLDFDTTTQEFAQFSVRMPKSWNESTVTAAFTWSHAATTTNFGVVWALEGVSLSDDDAGDAAFGTLQQIADTGGTTNDIYVSGATPAMTIAGTPAAEDWVVFQVKRVPSDGSDTMAVDARLHGVTLYFTTDAITDA